MDTTIEERDDMFEDLFNKNMYHRQFDGRNVPLLSLVFTPASIDKVEKFNFYSDDVIISSYPKSGTTWLSEILYLINNGGKYKVTDGKMITDRVKMLEFTDPSSGEIHVDSLAQAPATRIMNSHLPSSVFKAPLSSADARFVMAFRNPKDILVSFYGMYKKSPLPLEDLTWDQFFTHFYLAGELMFGDPFDWLDDWWRFKDQENVKFILYEDIIKDHAGTVKELAAFLGQEITDDVVEKIVEQTGFQVMEQSGSFPYKMGTGRVGTWREYFSPEQTNHVDEIMQTRLGRLGLKFD